MPYNGFNDAKECEREAYDHTDADVPLMRPEKPQILKILDAEEPDVVKIWKFMQHYCPIEGY